VEQPPAAIPSTNSGKTETRPEPEEKVHERFVDAALTSSKTKYDMSIEASVEDSDSDDPSATITTGLMKPRIVITGKCIRAVAVKRSLPETSQ
jgi:hypothetical protein